MARGADLEGCHTHTHTYIYIYIYIYIVWQEAIKAPLILQRRSILPQPVHSLWAPGNLPMREGLCFASSKYDLISVCLYAYIPSAFNRCHQRSELCNGLADMCAYCVAYGNMCCHWWFYWECILSPATYKIQSHINMCHKWCFWECKAYYIQDPSIWYQTTITQ